MEMTSEERFAKCCKIYRENREFKNFIFRLKRPGKQWNGFEVEELLKMRGIQEIADYYSNKPGNDSSPVSPMFFEKEDKSC